MNKYLTLILSIAVVGACANAVFAFRNDPVWQKERDRLMLQKDYSAVYAKSLETCAPYEKDYNLTELNGTRRINGMKDGFCNETILLKDKDGAADSIINCNYPKEKLSEIADYYKRIVPAEDKYLIDTKEEATESGLYKIIRSFDGVDYVQPTFYYCEMKK